MHSVSIPSRDIVSSLVVIVFLFNEIGGNAIIVCSLKITFVQVLCVGSRFHFSGSHERNVS